MAYTSQVNLCGTIASATGSADIRRFVQLVHVVTQQAAFWQT